MERKRGEADVEEERDEEERRAKEGAAEQEVMREDGSWRSPVGSQTR